MTGDYPPWYWPSPYPAPHPGHTWTGYTPSEEVAALQERVAELEAEVERLRRQVRRCPKRRVSKGGLWAS